MALIVEAQGIDIAQGDIRHVLRFNTRNALQHFKASGKQSGHLASNSRQIIGALQSERFFAELQRVKGGAGRFEQFVRFDRFSAGG
ncbi:hypothetical protein D3C84_924050 [compost metagenome]